jgi:glutaminyl-peptide cyclotransferase
MRPYNLLSIIFLSLLAVNCGDEKKPGEPLFTFNTQLLKAQYKPGEKVVLEVENPKNLAIDSAVFYINEKNVGKVGSGGKVEIALQGKFGYQNLKALVFFEGKQQEATDRVELVSDIQPKLLKYTIVNVYPHDINAFTEGLEFYRDTLIESTGQNGKSWFRKYDYKTGKVYSQVDLDRQYFGEGITVVDGKLFQLTWQDKTGFIYNAGNGKFVSKFTYDKNIEGWGMTNDGKFIYHSDGTEKIWKMDPATQKMVDYVNVYSGASKIKSINELEYVDGKIYGNIWQKDAIAVFDPATGAVEGVLNLADLRKQLTHPQAEVLNGIAYNPKTKTFLVTGKFWDKMFEIKVE